MSLNWLYEAVQFFDPGHDMSNVTKFISSDNLIKKICNAFINYENNLMDKVDKDSKKVITKDNKKIKPICLRNIRIMLYSGEFEMNEKINYVFTKYNINQISSFDEYNSLIVRFNSDAKVIETSYKNCK